MNYQNDKGNSGSIRDKRVHPSLLRERAQADFDTYELKLLLHENEENLKQKEKADLATEKYHVFRTSAEFYSWSREEKVRDAMRKIYHFKHKQKDIGFDGLNYKKMMIAQEGSIGQPPIELHYYMFVT
mmetsp:Transcript_19213/g.22224  ORF Transcript_19213/g.22224 Transcript_19213/m.22224 type:complete len:128 (+) Transcript_19213:47-430(+)